MWFSKPAAPPSLPAACANCMASMLGMAGGLPNLNGMLQFKLPDGRLRIDTGNLSIIMNPLLDLRILLDHLSFEARILAAPGMPGIPGLGALPMGPAMEAALLAAALIAGGPQSIIKLGKAIIQGLEAEGLRYLFATGSIAMWEIWTSTKFGLPVMTTTLGGFGQSLQICNIAGIIPPLSMFEIPPGYRIVNPPAMPIPGAPQIPVAPQVNSAVPQMPGVGMPPMPPGIVMPGTPAMPPTPQVPNMMPNVSGMPQPRMPMQALPNIPGFPQAPPPPQLPLNTANIPGLPKLPMPSAPPMQGLPNMSPNVAPAQPQMPGMPGFPGIPNMPAPQQAPNLMPGGLNAPPLPHLPNAAPPPMPNMTNLPGIPNIAPSLPNVPNVPQAPPIATPNLPSPNLPPLPKIPKIPGT